MAPWYHTWWVLSQPDVVDVVLGSRIRRREEVLAGGMPLVKYIANRGLTILENVVLGMNLPEYHTGYRAYHRRVLETIDFEGGSDDFVFDQHFLVQVRVHGFRVGSVPVPTHYGPESSSIPLGRSTKYALGTLVTLARYTLYRGRLALAGALPAPSGPPLAHIPSRVENDLRTVWPRVSEQMFIRVFPILPWPVFGRELHPADSRCLLAPFR